MNNSQKIRYIYAELKNYCQHSNDQEILELSNHVREICELSVIDPTIKYAQAKYFADEKDLKLAERPVDDFMTASAGEIFKHEKEIVDAVFYDADESEFLSCRQKNKFEELIYG